MRHRHLKKSKQTSVKNNSYKSPTKFLQNCRRLDKANNRRPEATRGISAASRTFEKQTEVHTLFKLDHSHVAYFVICERSIVDGHIVDHAGIADGEQGHADFPAEDGLAIPEGKRQYAL